MTLQISDLHVPIDNKSILDGIDLEIKPGEIHALMGPNGSGKSTLAQSLMGHPLFMPAKGKIVLDGEDITEAAPERRAEKGLFLSFQYPSSIPGVTVSNFLRTALNQSKGKELGLVEFNTLLKEKMAALQMDRSFARRYLNEGFSGGEKKRAEMLQMLLLDPAYAILDETDSGLDVDALRVVADAINAFHSEKKGILLITHYSRILELVKPTHVHILYKGRIVKSGGPELAKEIEDQGYHVHVGGEDVDLND